MLIEAECRRARAEAAAESGEGTLAREDLHAAADLFARLGAEREREDAEAYLEGMKNGG